MAQIAIALAITAASTALEYAFTPKPKKPDPIDRGKLDDARISIPALGAAMPKGWGTFRCAPIWIDHKPTDHRVEVTQGQEGGKGGGGTPPTADERKHIYTKSVIGVFHNGLVHKGVSKMWFSEKLVYNSNLATNEADTSAVRGEAEHGVLGGGASVVTQAECSGGRKVTGIGNGGTCAITVDVPTSGSYEIAAYYTSTVDLTFKVRVNGGSTADLFCPASGGASEVTSEVITRTLTAGANVIQFENSGAACPDLDRIDVAPALVFDPNGEDPRGFTGITRPGRFGPDIQDYAWPLSNEQPVFSDAEGGVTNGGFNQAALSEYGNPTIRFYNGSELQEADPIIIALRGLDLAPGYRGLGIIAIDNIQLVNGQMPNVTLEVQQGVRELPAIVTDIYKEVNVPAGWLDLSALNGKLLGDESGFDPGTYAAVNWTGLSNATQGSGGAITKTSGTNNSWNAYANSGDSIAVGQNAAIRFTAGSAGTYMVGFGYTTTPSGSLPHPYDQVPFAILLNKNSNPSQESKNAIQLSIGGSNNTYDVGVWSPGDKFQVEYRNGRFSAYQNGLMLTNFAAPVPSTFPLRVIFAGYAVGGGPSATTFATDSNIGTEPIVANGGGLFMESPAPAAELIAALMLRFQFTLPEVDGVVKAVLNNADSDLTIDYTELRAHRGDQRPTEDMIITRVDPLTLAWRTTVTYSDPAYSYHTRTQSEPRLFGPQQGVNDIVLPMIETAQNMKNLAITIANREEIEGQTYKLQLGPKYQHIHQGTVLTINARSGTQHKVRVKEVGLELPCGIVDVEGVRQDAAVFSPNGAPSDIGTETPVVRVLGNTKGVIVDSTLLRAEDAGDGTQPVVYVGMCGRGSGTWPGGFLYREFPFNSDNYTLLASSDKPSGIGVTVGTLPSVADASLWDRTSSLTVRFFSNTHLESVTEAEVLANPALNLLAIGKEYVQYVTASENSVVAPYISEFTISKFLRGRFGSDANVSTHTSTDDVLVIDSTVQPVRLSLTDIGRTIKLKFLTVGQGVDQALTIQQPVSGNSLLPLAPANLKASRDADGNILIEWTRRSRLGSGMRPGSDVPLAEETESYVVEVLNGSGQVIRSVPVAADAGCPALLQPVNDALDAPFVSSNNLLDPGNTHVLAYTMQQLGRGSWIEARLNANPNDGAQLGVVQPESARFLRQRGVAWPLNTFYSEVELRDASSVGTNMFTVYHGLGGPGFPPIVFESPQLPTGVTSARIRVEVGDRLRYYWDYTGSGSVPFFESDDAPPVPLVGQMTCTTINNAGCSITNVRVGQAFRPSTVYTTAQQTADSNAAVSVRVAQVSAIVGRGAWATITL